MFLSSLLLLLLFSRLFTAFHINLPVTCLSEFLLFQVDSLDDSPPFSCPPALLFLPLLIRFCLFLYSSVDPSPKPSSSPGNLLIIYDLLRLRWQPRQVPPGFTHGHINEISIANAAGSPALPLHWTRQPGCAGRLQGASRGTTSARLHLVGENIPAEGPRRKQGIRSTFGP